MTTLRPFPYVKNLVLRGNTFYYRKQIRENIQGEIISKNLRFSLHTSNYYEAAYLVSKIKENIMVKKVATKRCCVKKQTIRYKSGKTVTNITKYTGEDAKRFIESQEKIKKHELELKYKQKAITDAFDEEMECRKKPRIIAVKRSKVKHSIKSLWETAIKKIKLDGKPLSAKAQQDQTTYYKRVIDILGVSEDDDFSKITTVMVRNLSINLSKLPKDLGKKLKSGFSMKEILKESENLTDDKIMSWKTINHHISAFKKLATEANELYPEEYPQNLGNIIKELKKETTNGFIPFPAEQLKNLFAKDNYFTIENPGFFFPPLISLFTGSRENLCCTLQFRDVFKDEDGIYVINFNSEDGKSLNEKIKQTKNNSSQRIIPIHKTLLNIGFVDWIKWQIKKRNAEPEDYIFDELFFSSSKYDEDGLYQAFTKKMKELNIKPKSSETGRFAFHSFRNNFSIACENCGINSNYIDRIGGWKSRTGKNVRDEKYFKPNIKEIKVQLDKLDYPYLKKEFSDLGKEVKQYIKKNK